MTDSQQITKVDARNVSTVEGLTDSQSFESKALAAIQHRAIRKTGSFPKKLNAYSSAFAGTEKFDQMKAETIIRDQFKVTYGEAPNQMRERLLGNEAGLGLTAREDALTAARTIEPMIREGQTMPFYLAFDKAGCALAEKLDITETGAKSLMKSVFQEIEGRDLYETGKALEKTYHEPAREAARQSLEAAKQDGAAAPAKTRARKRG
tara:strand:- start:6295 stop:6915 length:621 start_codon:yes stop_codon:yes gene_type:complete